MSYTHLHARCSGRTTRMIKDAIKAIQEGRAAYVLFVNVESVKRAKEIFDQVCRTDAMYMTKEPKFETLKSIGMENIDWRNNSIHRAHPNCKLFIDHSVYDYMYGHIINGYHEYDDQMIVSSKWAIDVCRVLG